MSNRVSIRAKYLSKFWEKSIGLIGKQKPHSVLLRTRFGIHTLGMTYPIDVVIMNEEFSVVKVKSSLKPNSMLFWNPKFSLVLELAEGEIKNKNIQIGTIINLLLD